MKRIFVGNLPGSASNESVRALFSDFGTVRDIRINMDIFTGKCRGIGFVEMEGHEARAAIDGLHGKSFEGNQLKVCFEVPRNGKRSGRR